VKKYFFTGLIVLLPVVLTIVIMVFLFDFFTTPFMGPVASLLKLAETHFSIAIPSIINIFLARLIALILLSVFVLLLGMVAQWIVMRNTIRAMHQLLSRIPFIKTVFQVSRDVFSALFSNEGKKTFKCPVLVTFPARPNRSIGFHVGEIPSECQSKVNEPLVAVFTPTAPHPISGFLIFYPQKDVKSLDMSNEDALKFLVSCGMIVPENHDSQR
jgi:uncharacterized membrane protein